MLAGVAQTQAVPAEEAVPEVQGDHPPSTTQAWTAKPAPLPAGYVPGGLDADTLYQAIPYVGRGTNDDLVGVDVEEQALAVEQRQTIRSQSDLLAIEEMSQIEGRQLMGECLFAPASAKISTQAITHGGILSFCLNHGQILSWHVIVQLKI